MMQWQACEMESFHLVQLLLVRLAKSVVPRAGMKVRVCASELAAGAPSDVLEACRAAVLRLHYNGTHM